MKKNKFVPPEFWLETGIFLYTDKYGFMRGSFFDENVEMYTKAAALLAIAEVMKADGFGMPVYNTLEELYTHMVKWTHGSGIGNLITITDCGFEYDEENN